MRRMRKWMRMLKPFVKSKTFYVGQRDQEGPNDQMLKGLPDGSRIACVFDIRSKWFFTVR